MRTAGILNGNAYGAVYKVCRTDSGQSSQGKQVAENGLNTRLKSDNVTFGAKRSSGKRKKELRELSEEELLKTFPPNYVDYILNKKIHGTPELNKEALQRLTPEEFATYITKRLVSIRNTNYLGMCRTKFINTLVMFRYTEDEYKQELVNDFRKDMEEAKSKGVSEDVTMKFMSDLHMFLWPEEKEE